MVYGWMSDMARYWSELRDELGVVTSTSVIRVRVFSYILLLLGYVVSEEK